MWPMSEPVTECFSTLALAPALLPAQPGSKEANYDKTSSADRAKVTTAEAGSPNPNGGHGSAQLPITRVVLFTSGVGFFQRQGEVEGDARIDLQFPTEDVNDLLKSLVLRDLAHPHGA